MSVSMLVSLASKREKSTDVLSQQQLAGLTLVLASSPQNLSDATS